MIAINFFKEIFGGYKHYEEYEYTVVKTFEDGWELREYPQRVAATVANRKHDKKDRDGAFMQLARYIGVFSTPQNQGASGVAMTTPVVMKEECPIAMTTQWSCPLIMGKSRADKK